ncbi:hypothetical protein PP175_13740 [Aneurinibacillus sp. Ricciae_BoGa-3]|nr:hypothetical protein [Aneurinibacillus sp. Ricciae_BoGa-3]WCK52511.1 hypothetical protein PP175_13740 [Aneurinibacillus sp. Ricciae_BoGa-3]
MQEHESREEQIKEEKFEKEFNPEAFDVIKRLYDKTFRELVDR